MTIMNDHDMVVEGNFAPHGFTLLFSETYPGTDTVVPAKYYTTGVWSVHWVRFVVA